MHNALGLVVTECRLWHLHERSLEDPARAGGFFGLVSWSWVV